MAVKPAGPHAPAGSLERVGIISDTVMQILSQSDQRRNVVVNVLDAGFWVFGISFMSATTILPVFLRHLTESPLLIGLVAALLDTGWFLPQIFIAPYVQGRRQYGLVMSLGLIERLPFLVLPLALWLVPSLTQASALSLTVFYVLLALRALGSGIVAPSWQEFIARIIPLPIRGRFFSAQLFLGNFMALGGAAFAGLVLVRYAYPTNFIICFAIGAACLMVSWAFLSLSREPALLGPPPPSLSFNRSYITRLREILRTDANFRAFLISRGCAYMATMPLGFLAVAAITRFNLSDAQAAVFTTLLILGATIGNVVWGFVADRTGYKAVIAMGTLLWMAALLLSVFASVVPIMYAVFVLVGISTAATTVADLGIVMEFGAEAERPTYIGLARTSTAPLLAIAPLLGGLIAQNTSYQVLTLAALPFAALSLYLLQRRVQEPRRMALGEQTS